MLENKLGITNESEFAKEEERISKLKALELFDSGMISGFEIGTFYGLSKIHEYLFSDIYDFAGKIRNENMSKGGFRFASAMYLEEVLSKIDAMPQNSFENIVKKYVEMNIAHPFKEGNGRSMRIWVNMIFKKEIERVVDWSKIDKTEYLLAMERSPVKDTEISVLLKSALTDKVNDRTVYIKGIDASYRYEGLDGCSAGEL